jgi:hypothetical protein
MKSVAEQLREVADNLNKAGHTELVTETLRQDAGKNLEGKLAKLQTFAESVGATATVGRDALIEAAMKAFPELCPTKEAAARFASDRPVNSEYNELLAAVLKEK